MEILAHRGIHDKALENSLESFELAAQSEVSGVELDIRLTSDNEVVVFHDEDLKRLFENDRRIDELTFDELNEIASAEGVTVPKLTDIFDLLIADYIINVEIKEMKVVQPLIEMIREKAVSLEHLIFSSFIHESLLEIRKAFHEAKIGLLIGEDAQKSENPLEYLTRKIMTYKPYSLHLPVEAFRLLPSEMLLNQLKNAKQQMNLVFAWWTVNREDDAQMLLQNPDITDFIITDDHEMIKRKATERQ